MNLEWLRTFVTVVKTGSYTAAADSLGVSQPAVSKHMKHLEDAFGTTLTAWRGRTLVLTDAGIDVLNYAHQTLNEFERLTEGLRARGVRRPDTVVVASGPTYLYHYIPSLAETVRVTSKRIRLATVTILSQPDLTRAVADGRADIAVHSSLYSDDTLDRIPIVRDEFVVVANPGHAFASAPCVTAEDLARSEVYVLPDTAESRRLVDHWLAARGLAIADANEVGTLAEIRAVALATPSVGITSRLSVIDALTAGKLVEVQVEGFHIVRIAYASSRPNPSPATKEVLALMSEAFESTASPKR